MEKAVLIYHRSRSSGYTDEPPLVLMHDGGGTTFNYYLLNLAGGPRDVYAIGNPNWESESSWDGDFSSLAKLYVRFIRECVPAGKVILGGWSLGGILALEMAHQLAGADNDSAHHSVAGLLLIDSPNPLAERRGFVQSSTLFYDHGGRNTTEDTRRKVRASMKDAHRLLRSWKLPDWRSVGGYPPPGILLKALQDVPVSPGDRGKAGVDRNRDDRLLGWEQYEFDFIREVWPIQGHHLNIFAWDYLDGLTSAVELACEELASMQDSSSRNSSI